MSEAGEKLEGQVVDGKFPLLRSLGESDHSVAFLTERELDPRKAAIKLVPARSSEAGLQISRWEAAAKLSHPHLIRLFETGHCQINNEVYLYIVMEYAEENLYQILPDRPLSAAEAREMLPPVLDALGYLHNQGFVHGHIKPANIMASGDQLKISSDEVIRAGHTPDAARTPSLYDPPEATRTGRSPAGDVWSLGVTLVEALTQHPPFRTGTAEGQNLPPQSLPTPFAEIVRNCLRPRPEQRWSLGQIAASLDHPAASKPARAETPHQATFAKPGILLGTCVLAVILLAFFFVRLWRHSPEVRQSPPISSSSSPAAVPKPAFPKPPSKPAAPVGENTPQSNSTPAAATTSKAARADGSSAVVEQVLPKVPRNASDTIQGTIRVKVQVSVDPSGNVSYATLVSPGSSAYFAKLALQASHKWKFTPAESNAANISRTWILRFEFRQSGTKAGASANP